MTNNFDIKDLLEGLFNSAKTDRTQTCLPEISSLYGAHIAKVHPAHEPSKCPFLINNRKAK